VKRAFQKKALETHPDQGGDSAQFRAVLRAYERLVGKRKRVRKRG
jgi:curved DNA-binding protein CbpA